MQIYIKVTHHSYVIVVLQIYRSICRNANYILARVTRVCALLEWVCHGNILKFLLTPIVELIVGGPSTNRGDLCILTGLVPAQPCVIHGALLSLRALVAAPPTLEQRWQQQTLATRLLHRRALVCFHCKR